MLYLYSTCSMLTCESVLLKPLMLYCLGCTRIDGSRELVRPVSTQKLDLTSIVVFLATQWPFRFRKRCNSQCRSCKATQYPPKFVPGWTAGQNSVGGAHRSRNMNGPKDSQPCGEPSQSQVGSHTVLLSFFSVMKVLTQCSQLDCQGLTTHNS